METLELFSGSGSFSRVAKALGHNTFMVDKYLYAENPADLLIDILELDINHLPNNIDILWISPPLYCFQCCRNR